MIFDIQCLACPLGKGKTVPGNGSTEPKLIVVSDYPGSQETKERIPMVGRSGKLLRSALTNIVGLDVDNEVFITNALKCAPGKEKVTDKHLNTCKPWLTKELDAVKSKVILVAGSQAKKLLLPNVTEELSKIHGRVYNDPMRGYKLLVTWNPIYVDQFSSFDLKGRRVIQTGSLPWMFVNDMKKLKKLLDETY